MSIIRTKSQERMAAEVELLAAAQEQAREEEEISSRLPREVLNLHRQLDHQQNSIDALQGTMSNLTEMVAQIARSLNPTQQPPPSPPSTSPQQQFVTPPPPPPPESTSPPTPAYGPSTFSSVATSYPPEFGSFHSKSPCLTHEVTPIPTLAHIPIHGDPIPTSKRSNAGVPAKRSVMELHEHEVSRMVENKLSTFHRVSPDSVCQSGDLTRNDAGGKSIIDEQLVHKQPGPAIKSMANNDSSLSCVMHKAQTESSFYSLHAAPARVAPQVFGEMPTPISWQGTHGNINLSEQNVDGIPQAYGFHNLNRHSVFLTDGSEHSYFAQPENYPLERAVPVPVFDVYDDEKDGSSTEFVDVFVGITEQQKYEDQQESEKLAKIFHRASENAFSEQLLRYFSKAPETEQTSADVLDFTFEQQQQNDEKASANVQQLRDPQLTVLVIHERRREWDPGASVPTHVPQQSCYCRVPSSQESHEIQFLWDPGIWSVTDMLLSKTPVPNLMDPKHFWAQLLLQYRSCCTTPNAFLQVLYCYLPIVLDCLYSEPVKKLVCYTSLFSSNARCTSIAATVCMRLVLCSDEIAQELVDCSAIHACYLVSALLPPTQFAAKGSSNIELVV